MTETVTQAVDTPAPDANDIQDDVVADSSPAVETQPKGVGKRIDELTRNWRETERDRDYWRDIAVRNQSPQPKVETPAPDREKLKTLADFEYDDGKYQQYIFDEAQKRSVEAAKRELNADREREAGERRKASFVSRSTDFAKTVDDYDSVVRNPRLHISADMAEVIEDSDDGPALAYHLGKNPDVADKIAQLPPKAAARELGKIEARLAFEREKAKEKPVISKAPPPPPKVEGSDSAIRVSTTDADSDKLSDDEWVKAENARLKRKANRK